MKCTNPECGVQLDPGYNDFVIDADDHSLVKAFHCPRCGDEYQIRYETVGVQNVTRGDEVSL